jgi:hypothetical protein
MMYAALIILVAITSQQRALEVSIALMETLKKLHTLTANAAPISEQKCVEDVLKHIQSPEDLRRIALLSRAMTTGLAEHERVDQVYWTAFWIAARRLADNSDADSIMQLDQLAEQARLGGGELLKMSELRQRRPPILRPLRRRRHLRRRACSSSPATNETPPP